MKQELIKALIVSTAVVTLVASGGATTDAITGGNSGGSITTLDIAHAAQKTFTGQANELALVNGQAFLGSDSQTFSIKANNNGGYDVVMGGQSYQLTKADYDETTKIYTKLTANGNTVTFTSGRNTPEGKEYKYVDFVSAGIITQNKLSASSGFAVYGEKAQDMSKAGLTASYSGPVAAILIRKNNPTGVGGVEGKIDLLANFSTNKISGNIGSMKDVNGVVVPGQVNIEDGAITHNTFASNLSGSNTLNAHFGETVKGKLKGAFYGPNSEEAAGTLTLTSPNYVGAGSFGAKK